MFCQLVQIILVGRLGIPRDGRTVVKLDESLLTHIPPFSRLSREQIRQILDEARPERFDAGVPVFEEGMAADHFYLLLDGYIRVTRITPGGDQVIVLHIPSGQLFGIAKALGRTTFPATAVTAAESLILSWPTRLWDDFIIRYEGFAAETYQTVGRRIGEMNDRIVEMATQHVEQRVAAALLRLINQTGRKTGDGIEIDFPITRQDISEMTGTTLYTVSRLLSRWQKEGIVGSRRKHIMVHRPHELVALNEALLIA